MRDPYSVLGVSPTASDEEIKNKYRELARKYHPDNYEDDNPLKELANEKMQEINAAYDEIQRIRAGAGKSGASSGGAYKAGGAYTAGGAYSTAGGAVPPIYAKVRQDINNRRFRDAEAALMSVAEADRIAEWHFLMSLVLMQRNMGNDAMRELEIACSMDPSNFEYQRAKQMFNSNASAYGNTYYGSTANYRNRDRANDACDCCANLICLDCLCECMGGDLISCC